MRTSPPYCLELDENNAFRWVDDPRLCRPLAVELVERKTGVTAGDSRLS